MNNVRGSVVVGIDGSRAAELAAGWAAIDVRERERPVHLVFALGGVAPVLPGAYPMQCYYEGIDGNARERLDAAAEVVRAAAPRTAVTTAVTNQPPVPALLDLSRQACEIVLGSAGTGGFSGMLLGSVSVNVAARAHCPVVIVRGDSDATGPVVAAVDGSPASDAALTAAFEQAARGRVPLIAAHAQEPGHRAGSGTVGAAEHQDLADHVARWQRRYPEVDCRWIAERAEPRDLLVSYSRQARLVVVGSRGRGGFRGLLLGSTSQALLHHAECPVMVVRAAS